MLTREQTCQLICRYDQFEAKAIEQYIDINTATDRETLFGHALQLIDQLGQQATKVPEAAKPLIFVQTLAYLGLLHVTQLLNQQKEEDA